MRKIFGAFSFRDVTAGLMNAVVSIPDGLACAALAGVNPVYGLYTSVVAPTAGGLLQSSQLMQIATTSASALAAAQAISGYAPAHRSEAMFLLVMLIGAFLVLFGVFRAGGLIRFVSHSVMTGFLIGVAVVLVLDQLASFLGIAPSPGNEIVQLGGLLRHLAETRLATLAVGVTTIAIVLLLRRTRAATWASIVAVAVPTAAVALFGSAKVATVGDESLIPIGLPFPHLPPPNLLSFDLAGSAAAIAIIIAIQGAGVSQTLENPDRTPINPSRDMIAQGAANAAAGLFSGIPAGGSVGQTMLNISVGARSRWAAILHGLWMLLFILLLPWLVAAIPMAVLAALMILAGVGAINWREARSIWNVGGPARWALAVTFAATLVTSIPAAVGAGVVLTIFFQLLSSAREVRVRAVVRDNGQMIEGDPPAVLPSHQVTVLNIYGSLYFAGARTFAEKLPSPEGTEAPAVVLRLRGHQSVGATLVEVLDEYADELAVVGGRLYLSGVGTTVAEQLRRSGKLDLERSVHLVPEQPAIGASTEAALAMATEWLGSAAKDPPRLAHS
jgi:SulP family sulfate permease